MSFPTPNPAPVSLSTYDVHAFNGRTCLTEIHQLCTDFLHMQSHTCLAAASHLPPGMLAANNNKRSMICSLIKRNESASSRSSRLSISSTPMMPKSRSSTMNPVSSTTDHGEPSHGDHHHPGLSPNSSHSPLPRRIHPLPMKLTVSKINATCYCPQVHRRCAHQMFDDHTDFIDDDHDDIVSIFGEEVLHNIA